ncbi:MAG: endonuclease/exonuclease/phosphatase family protein [Bacteroidia bacterium]
MKEKRKRSSVGKLLFLFSIAVAITLSLGIFASYISPARFWAPAFFGLLFLYVYPVNFLFIIYYALRRRKHIIVPLIPAVLGFTIFLHAVNFIPAAKQEHPEGIKVMSYNVRLFDLYNWSHNRETRAKIFNYLTEEAPDIACFQEYYTEDSEAFRNTDTLVEILKTPYYQYNYTTHRVHNTRHWGIILFSKFPIINKGEINFETKGSNTATFADILVNKDTIRIYNAHLESIRFKKPDYEYVSDFKDNVEEKNWSGLRRIYNRLKNAFIKRAVETDQIAGHMKACNYPIIFCGDFNDPPSSYTYSCFSGFLKDAFKQGDAGFGATYNGPFPAFRIDYIMHSPAIKATSFKVVRNDLSDHCPVVAYLKIGE